MQCCALLNRVEMKVSKITPLLSQKNYKIHKEE